MSRKMMHKKTILPLPVKIAIAVLLGLCLLFVTVFSVTLAVIRNLDAGARELLCGTMTEQGFACTDWFFTSDEMAHATAYTVPTAGETSLPAGKADRPLPDSDTYTAFVYEVFSAGLRLSQNGSEAPADAVSIGLAAYPGMVFADDLLSYTGENEYERYCFCGMKADGQLFFGEQNPTEAVNAGYVFGISCPRILVQNGVPASDLRGGYDLRVAIGQRADGSLFLLVAAEKTDKLYPRGITYDGLAYLCAREGAIRAAALPVAGETLLAGKSAGSAPGTAGYRLIAPISGN